MKSLILALFCFGLVLWGIYQVAPYRPAPKRVRRAVRKPTVSAAAPLEPPPTMRRRRG